MTRTPGSNSPEWGCGQGGLAVLAKLNGSAEQQMLDGRMVSQNLHPRCSSGNTLNTLPQWADTCSVPDLGFPTVDLDAGMPPQCILQRNTRREEKGHHGVSLFSPFTLRNLVRILQKTCERNSCTSSSHLAQSLQHGPQSKTLMPSLEVTVARSTEINTHRRCWWTQQL